MAGFSKENCLWEILLGCSYYWTNKQTAIPTEEILPKLGSPLTGMDVEVKPQWSYLLIFLGVCSVISLSFL